jgi:mono/diheme cytochrome c family protein
MAERPTRRTRRSGARVGAVLLVLSGTACTPMDNLMVSVFGRSMRDQSSIGTYQNPILPPEGAVPFAGGNFPAAPGVVNLGQPEGTEVPVSVTPLQLLQALGNPEGFPEITGLQNPVPASPASLARGEQLFNRACVPCHGTGGAGDGLVGTVAPAYGYSLLQDQARGLSDGYLYSIIRVGRGAMPQYGHQISHFDRWHVVNYVRQLLGQ